MTLPQGFRYSAVYAGIRKAKKNDLSLIVSDGQLAPLRSSPPTACRRLR